MINIRKLNCGVTMVLDRIEDSRAAAIGFFVKAGSTNENLDNWGISHFIEHMMFKGTESRNAHDIAEEVDMMGAQINAYTSKETTCYFVKTLSSHLISSAEILIDMLTNSLFDEEEINRERNVILEEYKMTLDTPDDLAHELAEKAVNGGNPFGKSIIGDVDSINGINREKMMDYLSNWYTRDNIVVSVAGNFDEEEICQYIEGKLSKLGETLKGEHKYEAEEYVPGIEVVVKDIEQSHMFLGTESVKNTDPDYYTYTLVANILGGSMSSRLFQAVRERKGLAYSVYAANSSSSKNGGFYIYAGVAHENIEKAVDAIKVEMAKVREEGFTEKEMIKAKEQLKASFIFGQENVTTRMFSCGRALILTGNVKTDDEVLEAIESITLEDLNRVGRAVTDPAKYSVGAVVGKEVDFKGLLHS